MGGWGGGVSANEYSCAHGSPINFGDLTPYFTYDNTQQDSGFSQRITSLPLFSNSVKGGIFFLYIDIINFPEKEAHRVKKVILYSWCTVLSFYPNENVHSAL